MGFKEDADFARFVSMGAVGAAAVARHLSTEHNHQMIELERYAMANKVWQTKVKRLRLPDLVCVRCGLRVEARAKSKLGIVLSHSDTPGREWHAAGMRDGDLYAFLRADLGTFPPETSLPMFFTTEALRSSVEYARRSTPKAASEGSEVTLTWPCWVPSSSGTYLGTNDSGYGLYRNNRGNQQTYWQWRNWSCQEIMYLECNEPCEGGETIIAGIVPAPGSLDCPGQVWDLVTAMGVDDEADRYSAVKAAGVCERRDAHEALIALEADGTVDWRIRLEAVASLARLDAEGWIDTLTTLASSQAAAAGQPMEAVLALSELSTNFAADALMRLASDTDNPSELRAAAAWGLGQGGAPQPAFLLSLVLDHDEIVALHAIAAIDELTDEMQAVLADWLSRGDERRAAVAAHLLSQHQRIGSLLDACEQGGQAGVRALSALGDLPRETVRLAAGSRFTSEITTVLEPMWHRQNDWLKTEGKDGLDALEVQKVRFNPSKPGDPWRNGVT